MYCKKSIRTKNTGNWNSTEHPNESDIPIGLQPKCDFPIPGGESCNFECIFGEFNSVQRAYGKCQCRNGECSFSIPRATCAPTHAKYCSAERAMIPSHPMARTYCASVNSPEIGHLSIRLPVRD